MILGVPLETAAGERRVALVPESLGRLEEAGLEILVQSGAGNRAGYRDADYEAAGARIAQDAAGLYAAAELVARVQPPAPETVTDLREGTALVAQLLPFANLDCVRALAGQRVTSFSLDLMPRITRAQSMDVLSSQSTVSGYKAVLIAAVALPKLMPMLTTAAGTLRPSRVLVIGAGVAGLQAIATARRLGAQVEGFDIRAAVKEQVESLGARFVEDPQSEDAEAAGGYAREQTADQQARQRELLSEHIASSDAVICTALVPGRQAPVLVDEDQIKRMRPGSVVVDLAAEQGGNCSLTEKGQVVVRHQIEIHGPVNLPATAPLHASQMFSRNVMTYLLHMTDEGALTLDLEDEITVGTLVTHEGRIANDAVREAAEA